VAVRGNGGILSPVALARGRGQSPVAVKELMLIPHIM